MLERTLANILLVAGAANQQRRTVLVLVEIEKSSHDAVLAVVVHVEVMIESAGLKVITFGINRMVHLVMFDVRWSKRANITRTR